MRRLAIIFTATALLAGCVTPTVQNAAPVPLSSDRENDIRQLVRNQLKDPGSADFRAIRAYGANNVLYVCGEVNAKNSFGGYVGFSPFIIISPNTPGAVPNVNVAQASQDGVYAFYAVYPICRPA